VDRLAGEGNEQIAVSTGISGQRQDELAVRSHRLAAQAWADGFYTT
jgi:acetyl-CoA acyltransferase